MSIQTTIQTKLGDDLNPSLLNIENESHMHSGPATESHFKVTAVSDVFEGMSLVKRHQRIYGILSSELKNGVHALALHLFTPEEWRARQQSIPPSPDCRGGSKQA